MSIKQQLKNLPPSALLAIINDLYGRHRDMDDIIYRHLDEFSNPVDTKSAGNEQDQLTSALEYQLEQIIAEERFIDYYASHGHAYRLQSLLEDIGTLAEVSPNQALLLAEKILHRHEAIMEGVDDSSGSVGDTLRHAVDLWLSIAAKLRSDQPDARNWVKAVLGFFDNNDYGCLDDIISHSCDLLTEQELRQMAERFEIDAKIALTSTNPSAPGYNPKASHARIGMQSVAEALGDVILYEKATLLTSPQPNTLQVERIVEFALSINALERAAYWLDQPLWQEDKFRHARLSNLLLKKQGNTKQLKQNLLQAFQDTPNEHTLTEYCEIATNQEKQAIRKQVLQMADGLKNHSIAIQLLLVTDATEKASEHMVQYWDKLDNLFFGTLLSWVDQFKTLKDPLATILCYRLLIIDLLDRGYSKAYHHGADYYHALLTLDKQKPDYQGLGNAQDFIRQLRQKHSRKRSFWAQIK